MSHLRAAVLMFLSLTVITGLIYPAVVTVIAQAAFGHQANGSLITADGQVIGSELIGQSFSDPKYFWGRPSATSVPYDGGSSSGSNLGPTNPDLMKAINERVAVIRQAHPDQIGPIPVELVTASASGLDPHISPRAAEFQVSRIARVRAMTEEEVRRLVAVHTEQRTLSFIGEPRVNVLKLNLDLDVQHKGARP